MERIRYITLNGDSPKGKNYLFFAAHPEDGKFGLNTAKQELLHAEENCAIWYDATPELPCKATFWEELKLLPIRQVVVWVTSRLLNHSDSYIKDLLRYASEQNIGVLPLVREPRLEEQYKQHFGNIQYLDATSCDPTAIAYDEKLKRQLQTVFTSAEDFQRVRNAFAGYIFLSYRKKDRALANQLMKRIHMCQNLQDVAIWYDEFLVPGEDFNDGIRAALEGSDLFALLVTHNLLEPGNYVLKKEFPTAQKNNMEILPIQMAEVSHGLLRSVYEQFPKKVNGNDLPALEQALCKKFSFEKKAKNYEHDYLIGLAYWNGIDVEQDQPRGLELITEAAKSGITDAIQTLADIYKQKAFSFCLDNNTKKYCQVYCQILEYLYAQTPSAENAIELAQAYLRNGELECVYHIDLVAAICQCAKAKDLLRRQLGLSPEAEVYNALVDAHGTTACVLSSLNKFEESIAEFSEGETLCQTLYEKTGNTDFLCKKGRVQQKMAETMLTAHRIREAMRACKQGRKTAEELAALGNTVWSSRLLRNIYEMFANVYAALNNGQQWEQSEERMLRYAKDAAEASGDQVDYLLYMQLLDEQGEFFLSSGDNKKAILYYERIADACKMVKTDWFPEGFQRRYVKIMTNRGQSLYHAKKYSEAADTFALTYKHALSLMNTTKDAADQYNCAVILYMWGCADNNFELLEQSLSVLIPIRKQYSANEQYRQLETLVKTELKKKKE